MALFLLDLNLYQNSNLMPTRKTLLIVLPIFLLAILCLTNCFPPCVDAPNPQFKHSDWKLIAFDNSGKEPVLLTSNKAPINAFGLGITYTTTITGYEKGLECGFEPELYPFSGVFTKVLITCLQDFDPSHPAGVSLNDYFKELTYTPSTNLPSYAEISTASFYKYTKKTYNEVDFIMVQPPDHPGNYQFNLCLSFDYSSKCDLTSTTPVITFY